MKHVWYTDPSGETESNTSKLLAAFPKLFQTAELCKLKDVFQSILVTHLFRHALEFKVMQTLTCMLDSCM